MLFEISPEIHGHVLNTPSWTF